MYKEALFIHLNHEWDLYRFVQKIGGGVYKCVQVGGWVGRSYFRISKNITLLSARNCFISSKDKS